MFHIEGETEYAYLHPTVVEDRGEPVESAAWEESVGVEKEEYIAFCQRGSDIHLPPAAFGTAANDDAMTFSHLYRTVGGTTIGNDDFNGRIYASDSFDALTDGFFLVEGGNDDRKTDHG
jgi:hypothetical protein